MEYEEIQKLRELFLSELKESYPTVTIQILELVEMRVQTAIMAKTTKNSIQSKVPEIVVDRK